MAVCCFRHPSSVKKSGPKINIEVKCLSKIWDTMSYETIRDFVENC